MNFTERHTILDHEQLFVKNVRNFEALLDLLVSSTVLPHSIKDYILKADINEQKKELIHGIIKRGPAAFNKFISSLSRTDNHDLANLISQSKETKHEESGQTVKKAIYFMDHDLHKCYRMRSNPRGLALIVNMENFDSDKYEKRDGSAKDLADLERLWTQLGYSVTTHSDLTYTRLNEEVYKFSQRKELWNVDSCVVIIMSHGHAHINERSRGVSIVCHDNVPVHSQDVVRRFYVGNCPALASKPKIFFFQACRGELKELGVCPERSLVETVTNGISDLSVKDSCKACTSDFLACHSSAGSTEDISRNLTEHPNSQSDSVLFTHSNDVPTGDFVSTASAADTNCNGRYSLPASLFVDNVDNCNIVEDGVAINEDGTVPFMWGNSATGSNASTPRGADDSSRHVRNITGNGTDIILIYSSQPGYVSLRYKDTGGWAAQEICNVFAEHAHDHDLYDLLNKVMANLENNYLNSVKGLSLLHFENMHFKKRLYFNPGLF